MSRRPSGWTGRERSPVYDDPRWRRARAAVIRRDRGLCVSCLRAGRRTPYRDVDHVEPLSVGGAPFALRNLRLLCGPCHRAKTLWDRARADGREPAPWIGRDGYPIPWDDATGLPPARVIREGRI